MTWVTALIATFQLAVRHPELWGMPFPSDYMALYNASALAVKAVDSQLAVGGPATMQVRVRQEGKKERKQGR